jgi:iron complex transport system substrate-binding protein
MLLLALAAVLAAALAIAGCAAKPAAASQAPAQGAFPVPDPADPGREVTIAGRPERIVSLAPANTEIVAALGALDRLVGVTTFCDYPPEVASIPKVGDFVQPNLEAIAAADPDLVLVTGGVQAEVVGRLEELGATVLTVDPQSVACAIWSTPSTMRGPGRLTRLSSSTCTRPALTAASDAYPGRFPMSLGSLIEPLVARYTSGSAATSCSTE